MTADTGDTRAAPAYLVGMTLHLRSLLLALAAAGCTGTARPPEPPRTAAPTLTPQRSGTTQRLQAISPVSERIAWASGVGGTWVLTTDGGETWRSGVVPGADSLEFRDVEGMSEMVAYLLAAGPGDRSRIYRTEDGGRSWAVQFINRDTTAFYDCFAFWDSNRGFTMSDAVGGRFPVVRTTDGMIWTEVGDRLPAAQPGEGAFAASGTCTAVFGARHGWISTGAAMSPPPSKPWRVSRNSTLAPPEVAVPWAIGVSCARQVSPPSVVARTRARSAAPDSFADNVARSEDGGRTWRPATRTPFPGAIYGLAYLGRGSRAVVATGPSGTAWSADEAGTWRLLEGVTGYWAVAFASPQAGWLVGTDGRILRIGF